MGQGTSLAESERSEHMQAGAEHPCAVREDTGDQGAMKREWGGKCDGECSGKGGGSPKGAPKPH